MQVSVYTASHDFRWLAAAYASLQQQTLTDFEWVLVPNGDAARGDAGQLPEAIQQDTRVRVIPALPYADIGKVGALKRFAVSQCRGDLLVELDHDDTLAPRALEAVCQAVDGGAGFVYSDFIQLTSDGTCRTFGPEWGWETYLARVQGRQYTAVRAFAPTPASLMHIWWAPNHLRAWTRAAYEAAGGYDADLKVCDDLDLICRTYLAGVPFQHLDAPLYFYRLRKGAAQNSYLEYNDEIQRVDQRISNRHFYGLVDEWCRRERLARIIIEQPGKAIDAAANSVGMIRIYDLLHRVPAEQVPIVMNECYRVLAPGGWLQIRVPSTASQLAFADPLARSFWNRTSWWFYTRSLYAAQIPDLAVRFQEARSWEAAANAWDRSQKQLSVCADLCALKGQRQPGLQHL